MKNIIINSSSKLIVLLVSGACAFLSSCTANFEEANNPKQNLNYTELNRDNYINSSFLAQMENTAFPEQENTYQMTYDLIGNYLGRYFTYAKDGFSDNNFAKCNAPENWVSWPFRYITPVIESSFNEIKNISGEHSMAYNWAKLLRAQAIINLSDQYGPYPIGANKEDINAYSSQKDVYLSMLNDIDECIKHFTTYTQLNPGKILFNDVDKIYGGNFVKWTKYANSLKLRLAIRIRFVEPQLAQKLAEEAVAAGVITDNADNLAIAYNPNGLYKTSVEWGDTRACADIDSYLNGYKDPRAEKYFSAPSQTGNRHLIGCVAAAKIGNTKEAGKKYSAANVQENTKGVWMCAAECYFNMAEGATLGWNMGESAKSLYNKGIQTSFEQWGAGSAANYIENNSLTPANYTDAEGGYGQAMNAVSNVTIKWDDNASADVKQAKISTQKWIAMFPNGQEAWNEIRRTGYPAIFSITTSTNGFNLKTPNRIPFDPQERIRNPKNYEVAVQMLGGKDDYATKMWWQKH